MPRRLQVRDCLSLEKIEQKIWAAKTQQLRQKWTIVYTARINPFTAEEIATYVGVTRRHVYDAIAEYNSKGEKAFLRGQKIIRNRSYLTIAQEKEFLLDLIESQPKMRAIPVAEIKKAYEQRIGQTVHLTTVYRLLERHKWDKLVLKTYLD